MRADADFVDQRDLASIHGVELVARDVVTLTFLTYSSPF